jgi:hypothetical protein
MESVSYGLRKEKRWGGVPKLYKRALMQRSVDSFSPSSWEPQEEGMMSTAASFSLRKKPRFIKSRKKSILQKVMLASLLTLQQGRH